MARLAVLADRPRPRRCVAGGAAITLLGGTLRANTRTGDSAAAGRRDPGEWAAEEERRQRQTEDAEPDEG